MPSTSARPRGPQPPLVRRPSRALATVWVGFACAIGVTSCAEPADRGSVYPLEPGATAPEGPRDTSHDTEVRTPDHRDSTEVADPEPGARDQAALHEELAALLARYDSALSGLYAEPLAAADDAHPLTKEWLAVVVGGSQLDRQVRGRILAGATDDSMAVVPGPEGTSFSNTATEPALDRDGSVTWKNCGYAPGIGVHLETGEVLDDNRTSTRGHGRAVRSANGSLVVSELWDEEVRLLATGEPDPCPRQGENR